MRLRFFAAIFLATILCGFLLLASDTKKGVAKFEIQLLWGTDLATSPDEKHKPVDPDVDKFLKSLPLKFENYFLVNRKTVEVAVEGTKKEQISEKCAVEIKNRGDSKFELSLFGKSRDQVEKRPVRIPKGQIVAPWGGNAPGSNAWLVVLKRIE